MTPLQSLIKENEKFLEPEWKWLASYASPERREELQRFFVNKNRTTIRKILEAVIDIELLKRVQEILPNHSTTRAVNAVYITPAQQMRNAADRIEFEEKTARDFEKYINDLSTHITEELDKMDV